MAAHATNRSGSGGTLAPDACPLLELASAPASGASKVDPSNRCVSFSQARVIAVTQQRLVCFDDAHRDCPLFARAGHRGRSSGRDARAVPAPVAASPAVVARPRAVAVQPAGADAAGLAARTDRVDAAAPSDVGFVSGPLVAVTRASRGRQARPASRPMPTIVAAVILVVALGAAFTFTTLRGGLSLPGGGPGSSAIGAVSGALSASTAPGARTPISTVESASGSPISPGTATAVSPTSATPAPTSGPTAKPAATPTPGPVPTPTATLPPGFAGLDACPDRADCYLYRIRSGDNLTAVARRFGLTLTALLAANPEIVGPSLIHAGDLIRIPVPLPAP